MFYFKVDQSDNIYITFPYQNRIEKFNAAGDLILKITRELDYVENENLGSVEYTGEDGENYTKDITNRFSFDIHVDRNGRISVMTLLEQDTIRKMTEGSIPEQKPFMFGVYNSKVVLLCSVLPVEKIMPSKFYIHDNRFFMINAADMWVYEYRIMEN